MSQSTIDQHKTSLESYAFIYGGEITKENLLEWKDGMRKRMKPRSVAARITGINEYLKYIGKPALCLKRIRIQKAITVENVIQFADYERLLAALKADRNDRWYWMVRPMGATGGG